MEGRRSLLRDEAAPDLIDGCEPREAMAIEALTPVFEKAVVEFGHGTTMAAAIALIVANAMAAQRCALYSRVLAENADILESRGRREG